MKYFIWSSFKVNLFLGLFFIFQNISYAEPLVKWAYKINTTQTWIEDSEAIFNDSNHKHILQKDKTISISTVTLPLDLSHELNTKSKEQVAAQILEGKEKIFSMIGELNLKILSSDYFTSPIGKGLSLTYSYKIDGITFINNDRFYPVSGSTFLGTLSWRLNSNQQLLKQAKIDFDNIKIIQDQK